MTRLLTRLRACIRFRPVTSLLALAFSLVAAAVAPARAEIVLDVSQGVVQPMPIAVAPFTGDARTKDLGSQIAQVISANLERSGFFKPIDQAAFIDKSPDINVQPVFANWKSLNAQALVNGQASLDADGRLKVDFRLWDVFNEQQLIGLQFTATQDNWRRIAHKISDAIYKRLTGQDGYFDTRIVFVAESGPRGNKVKRLSIMDQDGANPSYLSDGSAMVMTPRFSANSQEITYMALRPDSARIYLFNIETGRQESLGEVKGMMFAPRFSPDGTKVTYSLERNGNIDIYVMDLHSRTTSRLTVDPAIDTSPSFSADGGQIVFNSDRGGSPQLYVMNADGGAAHRISFGSGRYTTPVWSPKGDLIAFTKQEGAQFHIGVMRPDGSEERILTTSYLDEAPTWAPNGRVLMFSHESGPGQASRLWTVDVSGRNERPAPYTGSATDPAWSPLLK
ncbi:MAG: Tol-Pal system beta propeller repeat protein TolB [Pseudomonadota bacterium]|jgi:TolB protein